MRLLGSSRNQRFRDDEAAGAARSGPGLLEDDARSVTARPIARQEPGVPGRPGRRASVGRPSAARSSARASPTCYSEPAGATTFIGARPASTSRTRSVSIDARDGLTGQAVSSGTLRERLLRDVRDQVVPRTRGSDGEGAERLRRRARRSSAGIDACVIDGGCSIRHSTPPRLSAQREDLACAATARAPLARRPSASERDHPAEAAHLPRRERVPGASAGPGR